MKRIYLLAIGALLSGNALYAQGTLNDYQRAFSLSSNFKDKVFYSDVNPQWIGNTNQFWYVRNTPQGSEVS
ncbi:MAG: peptidase dipeptidylpeptidase domain protein [Bacteroidetes bacterium]|nr:peptidase dipeptidylpeptidase domain protein [Bacteroidota bacterium]